MTDIYTSFLLGLGIGAGWGAGTVVGLALLWWRRKRRVLAEVVE